MKAIGTGMCIAAGALAGMVAGAYLVMSKPCVRRVYKLGKHTAKKMLGNL